MNLLNHMTWILFSFWTYNLTVIGLITIEGKYYSNVRQDGISDHFPSQKVFELFSDHETRVDFKAE